MKLPNPNHVESFLVRVKTRAQQDQILGWDGEVLRVAIKAQPVDGKANARLVKFLKKELGAAVQIKSGPSSKEKKLLFV